MVNTGKPWSETDLQDIRNFSRVMTRAQLAHYLCRPVKEVSIKLKEMNLPTHDVE